MHHIRFIHCADLHLDSRMESHLSFIQAQTRRKELFHTFFRLADYAAANEVRAILISGDLFDTNRISPSTISSLRDCMQGHPQIDFLYLPGNHDAQIKNIFALEKAWPSNFWVFEETKQNSNPATASTVSSFQTFTSRTYDAVTITGIGSNLTPLQTLSSEQIHLLMLHGQITSSKSATSPRDSCFYYDRHDLAQKSIAYIAAGHVHQYQTEWIDNRTLFCYSGCLEGRGFDECGEKGFVLLNISWKNTAYASCSNQSTALIDNYHIEPHFIPFAYRRFYDLEFDLTDTTEYVDLEKQIGKLLSEIDAHHLIRLKLTGSIPAEYIVPIDFLLQKYAADFFFLCIENHTRPMIFYEDYQYDFSLKGEFIRLVLSDSKLSDSEKEAIITEGLRALAGEESLIYL